MKVIVCGDRNWSDYAKIHGRLSRLPKGTTVIQGGCRGADKLAGRAAKNLGLDVLEMPAEWDRYGPSAGPRRNRKMLDLGPGLVIAFHPNLGNSKGTKDTVEEAVKRGIRVEVVA
jgi:hypothetical protein